MSLFGTKFPTFVEMRQYSSAAKADKDTSQCLRDANIGNLYSGQTVGLNTGITGDQHDGVLNRIPTGFKDRAIYATGETPKTTFALIA